MPENPPSTPLKAQSQPMFPVIFSKPSDVKIYVIFKTVLLQVYSIKYQ